MTPVPTPDGDSVSNIPLPKLPESLSRYRKQNQTAGGENDEGSRRAVSSLAVSQEEIARIRAEIEAGKQEPTSVPKPPSPAPVPKPNSPLGSAPTGEILANKSSQSSLDPELERKIRDRLKAATKIDPGIQQDFGTQRWLVVDKRRGFVYCNAVEKNEDAVFIARSHEYVEALLAEIDSLRSALQSEVERLQDAVGRNARP